MVQSGSIEPFDIDFDYVISIIQKHYPSIRSVEGFCLNAKAIKELSMVLLRQNDWIIHQSSTLYKDPFMLNQQLMKIDIGAIAIAFLKSWHPMIELEQISVRTLAESIGYWGELLSINERNNDSNVEPQDTQFVALNEILSLGLIPEEGFTEIIEAFWNELGEKTGKEGSINYWDWIGANTYEETVKRAYLTVFMVGYGYADMIWDRLLDKTVIIYKDDFKPESDFEKISLPVMVDYEEWKLRCQK
jgi:hypothetical protein